MPVIYANQGGDAGDSLREFGRTMMQFQAMKEQQKLQKEQLKLAQGEQEMQQQKLAAVRAEQQNAMGNLMALQQNPGLWSQVQQLDPTFAGQVQGAMAPIGNAAAGPTAFVDSMARMPQLAEKAESLKSRAQYASSFDTLISQAQERIKTASSPEERSLAQTEIARYKQMKVAVGSAANPATAIQDLVQTGTLAAGEAEAVKLQGMKFELKEQKSQYDANQWAMTKLGELRPELRGAPGVDKNAYSYVTSLLVARDAEEQRRKTDSARASLDAKAAEMAFAAQSYKMHYDAMTGRPGPDGKPMSAGQAQVMARNAMYTDLDNFGYGNLSASLRQSGGQQFVERYATASSMVDNYVNAYLRRRWEQVKGGTLPEQFRGNVDLLNPRDRQALNDYLLKNHLKPIDAKEVAMLKDALKTHLRVNINTSGERGRMGEEVIAAVLNDTQAFKNIDTFNQGVEKVKDMTINPMKRPSAPKPRGVRGSSTFGADATNARIGSPPEDTPFPARGQLGQLPMGALLEGDWDQARKQLENPNLWQRDLPEKPPKRYLPPPPEPGDISRYWMSAAAQTGGARPTQPDSLSSMPPRP